MVGTCRTRLGNENNRPNGNYGAENEWFRLLGVSGLDRSLLFSYTLKITGC